MGLDFRRAADLFMGKEDELARALGVEPGVVREHRRHPGGAPAPLLVRLAAVLEERGRAMVRVSEMLREEASGPESNGAGGRA